MRDSQSQLLLIFPIFALLLSLMRFWMILRLLKSQVVSLQHLWKDFLEVFQSFCFLIFGKIRVNPFLTDKQWKMYFFLQLKQPVINKLNNGLLKLQKFFILTSSEMNRTFLITNLSFSGIKAVEKIRGCEITILLFLINDSLN